VSTLSLDSEEIEMNKDFRLFLICVEPRCVFAPEFLVHMKAVNFHMSASALLETFRHKCIEVIEKKP